MTHFYWLDQVQPSHHSIVGDQALSLGLLMQRGYEVLPGGVITTIAFEQFLESIHSLEPLLADLPHSTLHTDVDDARQLQSIARQIRHAIHTTPLSIDWLPSTWPASVLLLRPQLVLHPTAEVIAAEANSWLEPQTCSASDAIAVAIKQVWSEVFRARSLLYWQRSNLPLQQLRLAVLVQPLAAGAIASGRVQIRSDSIELQAQWGLGGIAELGDAIADTYRLDAQHHVEQQIVSKTHQLQLRDRCSNQECLEWAAIAPAQQQASVLDRVQLQELVQLAQQIAIDTSTNVNLEWLLTRDPKPQMQITQVLTPSPLAGAFAVLPTNHSVLVRGLAAATGQSIGKAWVLDETTIPADLPAGAILVASWLALESLSRLQHAGGIVLERGSLTSHSAIVARELGIPAIVGAVNATQRVRTGDWVGLDGDRGILYRVSSDNLPTAVASVVPAPLPPIAPPSGSQTALMVNLNQLAMLEAVAALPIAGIGLLRAELLLEVLQSSTTETTSNYIADRIRPFVRAMYPRPVYYRSLDRSIYQNHLQLETNPLLGLHGTFSYQLDSDWFERELRALWQLQQEGYDNVHLLLPFVRTVEEFRFCRSLVQQAGLTHTSTFQLWIMAEVPSVLFLLPDYVKAGVQGIAIGSNDLTQLLLGVDRDQSQFASYSQMHPAVLSAIRQLVQTARDLNIPCSICGQAPSQFPELVASLVQWGITAISVEPQAIEATARAIATADGHTGTVDEAQSRANQPSQKR